MFERLKRSLVESFIGAIALGYLLAQVMLHFVNLFAAPLALWASRNEYRDLTTHSATPVGFPFQAVVPELVSFVLLLGLWYILLRWLYFSPLKTKTPEPSSSPEKGS